ncbi:hypothetical protein C8F04DRAFT_1129643 [Mycena alexandri]|uniref:Uncharacterized protein n=1 Tax=Mycena alexandri TaxID=1745969 RepID=A0AAD6SGN4_9AGAR|nr:hypothetical protein C8F04DRAFT_1129643 [Mycena alexandri]
MRPAYHTLDRNPPRGAYTAAPEGGHRPIYGVTSRSLYRNHSTTQLRNWKADTRHKVVFTISGGNGLRALTQPELVRFFSDYLNLDDVHRERMEVGAPNREGPGPDPIAWIVTGLRESHARHLLRIRQLSADNGRTVFFHCIDPQISGYVGTFVGLTIPSSKRELACSLIAGAISDDPRIASYVRSHRDRFPPEVSADEALARFCEHISVADITLLAPGNSGEYVGWNVYVEPFTDYEDVFAPFIDLVAGLEINTDWNGQGLISKRVFHCNICPGTDHPTNLCPVPSTPGYMGPTPATITALLDASREAANPGAKKSRNDRAKFDKNKGKGDRKGKKGRDNRNARD